jgi:hypothetical protein
MYLVNDDLSIYVTRGDILCFTVDAVDEDTGKPYEFQPGDIVRMKVFGKKDAENVVMQKDFPVAAKTESVGIFLTESDTKIGEVISKPTDYWYEIELNPFTNPQTIIGYDEDGAKIFKLFPEGRDLVEDDPVEPEDIPVVDTDLSLLSSRPVENKAISRAITLLKNDLLAADTRLTAKVKANEKNSNELTERFNNLIAMDNPSLSQSLEYLEAITEETRAKIDGSIKSDGVFASIIVNWREANQVYGGTEMPMFIIPDKCRPMEVGLIHTDDGLEYNIKYDGSRYYMSFTAQNDVAPSGAGSVAFSYALGDYELKDIRLGVDGKTYESAGEAVRNQIMDLSAEFNSSFIETGYADQYVSNCNVLTDEYEHLMISDIRRGYENETGFRIYSCDETGKTFEYVSTVTLAEDFSKGYVEHYFGKNSFLKCYVDLTAMESGNRRTGDGRPFVLKRECVSPMSIKVDRLKNVLFAACNTEPKKILTWVDDDTPLDGIAFVKTICDNLGVKCTFATITQGWSEALVEVLRQYQREGFHIACHTESHGRWYKDMPDGAMFNALEMEGDLLASLEKMRAEGFVDCDMLVYPGSATGRKDVNTIGIAKKWCKCGVLAGGTTWSKHGQGKYKINRTFISKSAYDTSYYKNLLNSVTDEAWVVFGTHSGSATDFDADMMTEILSYALENGWAIMPLNEALKYREKYYHIQEMLGL